MSCEEPETGGPSGDDPATFATTPPPPASSGLPKTPPPTNLQSAATTQSSGDKSTADEINLPMEELNISEEPETGESSEDDPATSVPTPPPPAASGLPKTPPPTNLPSSATTRSSGDKKLISPAEFISMVKEMWGKLKKIDFCTNPWECNKAYNAVQHADKNHFSYIEKYGNSTKSVLFLGMNPGPSGTKQITGVPFGETNYVKDWLEITEKDVEFGSSRSGPRFWKLCKDLCGTPENFFKEYFVYDYCPLTFRNNQDRNVTPEMLSKKMRLSLTEVCDEFLYRLIKLLEVEVVVAIGRFAEKRTEEVLEKRKVEGVRVVYMMHPSPINPSTNDQGGWQQIAENTLKEHDLIKYMSK